MSHELRALVTSHAAAQLAGSEVAWVRLPQGFALGPVTDDVFDLLGGGTEKPFGDAFWFLSGGVRDLALQLSRRSPVAYLEVDFFGGAGTQASVAWSESDVVFGPSGHEFRAGQEEPPRSTWPVNAALKVIGVACADSVDQFEALQLGQRRATGDWLQLG